MISKRTLNKCNWIERYLKWSMNFRSFENLKIGNGRNKILKIKLFKSTTELVKKVNGNS